MVQKTFFSLFLILLITIIPTFIYADTKSDIAGKIEEYERKVKDLQQQKTTLAAQIQYMDTQSQLAELRILETEKKIEVVEKEIITLSSRIDGLDSSLNYLSESLIERIAEGYKNRSVTIFDVIFDSENAGQLMQRYKYFNATQINNQKVLLQVQETKLNFEEQKQLREKRKQELDSLKLTLDNQKATLQNQKAAKQKFLAQTKNDETTYQALLEKARAEYIAIQAITSGAGAASENSNGEVTKGTVIASVIPGPSCNSGGGHLHFILKQGGSTINPFSLLKPVPFNNCSGSSCGSSDGDPFNPSGSMDWPLNGTISMNQGYGRTWAVNNTWIGNIYNFHDGLDINGSSNEVYAVADGTAYRGGFRGGNGCTLPYVKLVHKDSNLVSYYLHVYPR